MSHAVKLSFFFVVSVALHGAGLWAAAGRFEPHEPEPAAEVAIVDRDLFFRHAARSEVQASAPVSATDRLAPLSADVVRPHQPRESVAGAPAATASQSEPERREPESASTRVARLDLATVDAAPPPRRDAVALNHGDAERDEPVRMAGAAAALPRAAVRPRVERHSPAALHAQTAETMAGARPAGAASPAVAPSLQPATDATRAAPAGATEPERAPMTRQVHARAGEAERARTDTRVDARAAEPLARTDAERGARGTVDVAARAEASPAPSPATVRGEPEAAEPLARTAAERGARGTVDVAARAEASPAPSPATVRGEPEAAPPVTTAEAPRLRSPSPRAATGVPARAAVRGSITIGARRPADTPAVPDVARRRTADARSMAAAEPVRAPRDRPSLRGTLPAPLLDPRQAQWAEAPDAPVLASAPPAASRLRPSLPSEPERPRTGAPAAQGEAAPPAERRATPPAPRPAPARTAESSRDLAALAPETPRRRLQQSQEPPAGRNEPADRFTRSYEGGDCFFPLRIASRDGAAIRGYGLQAESVDMFREAFAQALGIDPDVRWRRLTDAQCAGISFTRLVLGDASPSLRIALERKELDFGRNLSGRVTGSRFDFVTLLLVDDSGVVHNVLDYLRPATDDETDDLAFAIPVQPVDDGTDRVQLIMAVGASHPLPALETTLPVHSDDFFPELLAQTREAGATLELGLEDFVILGDGN